eukprot:3805070-Amphidinium_carterae.1
MGLADTAATVGYVTDSGKRSWLALPGCRQSVFRAELLAVVRALEERQPRTVVSDCKGVVKALQAIQSGHRQPKGRHRDPLSGLPARLGQSEGPHRRVVTFNTFARCLDCHWQTGKAPGVPAP